MNATEMNTFTFKGHVIKAEQTLCLLKTKHDWWIIKPPPPGNASYQRAKRRKAMRRKRK